MELRYDPTLLLALPATKWDRQRREAVLPSRARIDLAFSDCNLAGIRINDLPAE
jgi:hypothetical protein